MEKQRAVNTVTANDEYSQNLMKMYENWMDGDTFQGSYKGETVKEEEIPTGQKRLWRGSQPDFLIWICRHILDDYYGDLILIEFFSIGSSSKGDLSSL